MKTHHKSLFGPGAASSGLRIQETQKKDDSTRNSKVMTRAQKAQAEGARKPAQKDKAGGGTGHLKAQRGRVSRGARTGDAALKWPLEGGGSTGEAA